MEQAIVAVAGAIVVALITAVTTNRRLSKQLTAESERQERAIEAQDERQRAELEAADEGHRATLRAERDSTDLADERTLLDEVAMALYRANDAGGEVRVALSQHGRAIAEQRPDVLDALREQGLELDALLARASIRFDSGEPLLRSLNSAAHWLELISSALAWLEDEDSASWKAKREKLNGDIQESAEGPAADLGSRRVAESGVSRAAGRGLRDEMVIAIELKQALEQLGSRADDVTVLAVGADPDGDTRADVRRWLQKLRLPDNFRYLIGTAKQLQPV